MNIVLDASVDIKWFFRSPDNEDDIDAALALLRGVSDGRLRLMEPPHFVTEVSAVLAREAPSMAKSWVANLLEIEMAHVDGKAVLHRAVDLSIRLDHHLFDTLYHAVALETPDALLVTADERYYRKANRAGRIVRLADFDTVR